MHQRLEVCEACRVALCVLPDVMQSAKKSLCSQHHVTCYALTCPTMP